MSKTLYTRQRKLVRRPRWLGAALLLAVVVVFLTVADGALGCPTCKEGLAEHDPVFAGMVRGYFWSILFMMSMPFLILGGLTSYFYYEVRRARARQAQLAKTAAEPVLDPA